VDDPGHHLSRQLRPRPARGGIPRRRRNPELGTAAGDRPGRVRGRQGRPGGAYGLERRDPERGHKGHWPGRAGMPAEATAISVGTWRQEWSAGRSRDPDERGRGSTGDLGPWRPGPNADGIAPQNGYRKACSGNGTRRETDGKPAPGDGPRARTTDRRTKGYQRRTPEAGKPEDGGRRGQIPAGKRETGGKPAGTPEAVRSGPKPPGESPGIWGRTHPPRRWRSPGRVGRRARLTPAHLAPRTGRPSDARRRLARDAGVPWISISPPHREAAGMCQPGGMPT
jgi:hypothetical protein